MSHQERNGVRAAYTHKAEFQDERKLMMQWWACKYPRKTHHSLLEIFRHTDYVT